MIIAGLNLYKRRVARDSQVVQMMQVVQFQKGQLVVPGIKLGDVVHVVHGAQATDLAVLAVQIGDGRAVFQAIDGL